MMEGDKYDDDSEEVVEMMGIVGGSCNNSSTSGGGGSSSRWNPTKEQIRMLENLYKEGIRTPTAEEIQHITARLRVYGHIEGKNVFYWFQNHKARQRQKQKQHSIAYFNRFLNHPHHPLFTSTPPNNPMCGPYCMAQQGQSTEMGFYHHHQHPKVLVPVGISRRNNNNPNNEKVVVPMGMMPPRSTMCTPNNAPVVSVPVPVPLVYEGAMIQQMQQQQQQQTIISDCNNLSNQETLDLFPLHPTGILGGKPTEDNNNNKVVLVVSPDHHHQYGYGNQNQNQKPSFFDFFTSRATSD